MTNIDRKLSDSSFENQFTFIDQSDVQSLRERAKSTSETQNSQKKSNTKRPPPEGTIQYEVNSNDTIERIALKYNTIPSEILHLNRLSTRMLYPGQILYVPDPDYVPPPKPTVPTLTAPTVKQPINNVVTINEIQSNESSAKTHHFKWKTNAAPKPGHIEAIKRSNTVADEKITQTKTQVTEHQHLRHTLSEDEAKKLDEECMQRFLKINSKIITYNKGVTDGVLLITPSAVMFDPIDQNLNLKKQTINGSERDNMGRRSEIINPSTSYENVKKFRECQSPESELESIIIPIEIISNVILYEDLSLRDIHDYFELRRNELRNSESENPKIKPTKTPLSSKSSSPPSSSSSSSVSKDEKKRTLSDEIINSIEKSINIGDTNDILKSISNENIKNLKITERRSSLKNIDDLLLNEKHKLIRRLSTSLIQINQTNVQKENTNINQDENENEKNFNENMNEALRRHSINNIPNLFDDDLLCYLCIKVNNHKDFISCPMDRKMRNRLQPEFWFQVPDNSYKITDKICAFFLAWKFDPTYALSPETPRGRFQLVKDDSKLISNDKNNANISMNSSIKLLDKCDSFIKDWEVVNLHELEQKLKVEKENESLQLPKLIGESKILKDEHLRILNCNLIARAVSYDWILTFSTELNGFSLSTLYRQMAEVESPCLIVVRDTNNNVFGAMTSCKLYQWDHFYGTGESFLYTFYPTFKIFKWTGDNNFFIKGDAQSLGIGCGDGIYGLWLDGDLYHGRTKKCKTYDNDILTSSEDFVIAALEIWTFLD